MPEEMDGLPPGFGAPGQPETIPTGDAGYTPPIPPVAPAAPLAQPIASQPTLTIDGRPLTEAEVREAIKYRENYNKWRTQVSNEAAEVHRMRDQIQAEYGTWKELAEGLAGNEDLRDKYLSDLRARYGQAAPAAPSIPGQAPAVPPEVQAALAKQEQELRILRAAYDEQLLERAEGNWAQARDQYRKDFGQEMPLEVERDMKILLQRNRGLVDLQIPYLAVNRGRYEARWRGQQGQNANAGFAAAQQAAAQMATGGTPGPGSPTQTNVATENYADAVRRGRMMAGGSPDAEYNPFVDFGTR